MTPRPSEFLVGWWLVFGASVSSVATAVTGFGHPNPLTVIGIENPAIRVLLFWIVTVAVQFVIWWIWTFARQKL